MSAMVYHASVKRWIKKRPVSFGGKIDSKILQEEQVDPSTASLAWLLCVVNKAQSLTVRFKVTGKPQYHVLLM